jgi:Ca2+-binding RTX toxin-like protein
LSGGAGDDAITDGDGTTGDPGGDVIDGGPGERDSVSYAQRTGAVRIDLAQPDGLQGAAGDADKLVNVENVSTGSGNDVLRGDGVRNRLDGGDGADTVDGRDGDDLLLGGAGPDAVDGGPGNDEIVARDLYRDVVSCGAGRDQALVDIGDVIGGCEGTTRTVVDLIPGRYRLGVRDRRTSIRPACPDLDELPRTVAREFESCSFRVVLKLPVGGRMVVAGQTQCGLKGCKPLVLRANAWRMLIRKRSVIGRIEFFRQPSRGALPHAERVTVLRRRG